jgi:transcription antitermination factor NusG
VPLGAKPHPYLTVGRRVRIQRGILAGVEGILIRRKNALRVVMSIDPIMRSVSVEVDASDLE